MAEKAYKGFDKDLKCRDYQYKVGREYEAEGKIKACNNGFHACEIPLDVWNYYPPGDSRYCEVEQSGETSREGEDSKVASQKIKIGAEIGIPELVKAHIEWVRKSCENAPEQIAQGYRGNAAAQGYRGHAAAQGDRGLAAAQGNSGHAAAQGFRGHAAAQGYRGNAAAQGNSGHAAAQGTYGHAAAQGDRGHAAAQGTYGHAAAQGDRGHAAAQGDCGHAAVKGKDSIAAAFGIEGAARAAMGSWIMCAEWEYTDGWHIKCVRAAQIDGKRLKPDTWYMLKNGEFVETEE